MVTPAKMKRRECGRAQGGPLFCLAHPLDICNPLGRILGGCCVNGHPWRHTNVQINHVTWGLLMVNTNRLSAAVASLTLPREPVFSRGRGEQYRPNVTRTFVEVLAVIQERDPAPITGAEICRGTGIKSGTVYPMLARLHDRGWLCMEHEAIDPSKEGRPRRKFYGLTERGRVEARRILQEVGIRDADDDCASPLSPDSLGVTTA